MNALLKQKTASRFNVLHRSTLNPFFPLFFHSEAQPGTASVVYHNIFVSASIHRRCEAFRTDFRAVFSSAPLFRWMPTEKGKIAELSRALSL